MLRQILYYANDGKKFDNEADCVAYEADLKRQKKELILVAAIKIDDCLWDKYFPNHGPVNEPKLHEAFIWLSNDLPAITLRSDAHPSLGALETEILSFEYGKEVVNKLDFNRMERKVAICSDWACALRGVKKGSELSFDIDWSLHPMDLKELAILHAANKFRNKIEDLLTDCNFHSECSDFSSHNYSKYLSYSYSV